MAYENFKTPSRTSPRNGRRGCLCENNTYHVDCCDGSLQAQGIGNIYSLPYLLQEDLTPLTTEEFNLILL